MGEALVSPEKVILKPHRHHLKSLLDKMGSSSFQPACNRAGVEESLCNLHDHCGMSLHKYGHLGQPEAANSALQKLEFRHHIHFSKSAWNKQKLLTEVSNFTPIIDFC